jgi:amino acid permease
MYEFDTFPFAVIILVCWLVVCLCLILYARCFLNQEDPAQSVWKDNTLYVVGRGD